MRDKDTSTLREMFQYSYHCDPRLNQTKFNDLLPLTIHGVLDIISGGRESFFFIFIRLTFAIAMRLLHFAVSIQIGTNVSQFFPVKYFQCETHKQFVSNLLV